MSEKYNELKREFDQYYKEAQECRAKGDFYNLVVNLRNASQSLLDMTEHCSPNERGSLLTRSRDLLDKAKQWQEAHPEAFANTNQATTGGRRANKKRETVVKTGTTFNDIVGCEDIKNFVIKQYIKRFDERYSLVFRDGRGGNLERGILLFGLPGTGKTMMARAIATEVKAHFVSVKGSDLKDRFYGETEKKIRELYEEAAAQAEKSGTISIVFIDEVETLIPSRSSDVQNHESSAVTEFLGVLDGFDKEKMSKIITIAATNYPNKIDAAALRHGRLGAWFRVDVPTAELREKLIKKHFENGYTFEAGAMAAIVKKTRGYSSADVVSLCEKIKSELSDRGIVAVDRNLGNDAVVRASSNITISVIELALKTSNSSISQNSIIELAAFEKNYNYACANGGIIEFMKNLK
jgi:transitional endoplasmic reticulum ATPase